MKIHWLDFIANEEVLAKSDVVDIEGMLAQSRIWWLGHVSRNLWKIIELVNGCCMVSLQMVLDQSVAPSSVLRTTAKAF